MLESFTDKDLKNRFCLNIKVEEPKLFVIQLDSFIITILVRNILRRSWLVYVEIPRYRVLVDHIILII